jgi:hypothetical protein
MVSAALICHLSSVQQNQILESKIQRPATMASKKSALLAPSGTAIAASVATVRF